LIKKVAIFEERRSVAIRSDGDRYGRTSSMAKGMSKRGRDEKKPKKQVPKVIAAAPSTKDVVAATVKAKGK